MDINPNLSCKVCGENSFNLREGFYYCDECGTKQDQVRAIEVERDEDFNDTSRHAKKQKIHAVKATKPELTSWECYNYILYGLVENLMSMGAKEELKLMVLQMWAAFLRRNEVAFFNKKHAELPKLGARYHKRDSAVLFNHTQAQRKKRQRRRTEDSSKCSEASMREWRKTKRKLDESEYSQRSVTSIESSSQFSTNTSTTGGTTRAIQFKYSSLARKQYKKVMPIKHLEKHEKDGKGLLQCHKKPPKVRDLNRFDHSVTTLNMKQIYTILAISLNLVEDEINLCDLVRFMHEDRLLSKNVSEYFPENIAPHCEELLNDIGFFRQSTKFTYKAMREQVGNLARFLCIKDFHNPDFVKLTQRYVADLNLPAEVGVFVERLINLLPPQMNTRATSNYPAYEVRAMAYIVFVLKLLFGLDGHKELLISNSAKNINSKLEDLKVEDDTQKPLFIWSEWMQFIEMRKIIVAQYNHSFCSQFNQCQSTAQMIAEISHEQQSQVEENNFASQQDTFQKKESKLVNIKRIFEKFLQDYNKTPEEPVENISFPPSFMPSHSYFKRILLHVSSVDRESSTSSSPIVVIPEFMRIDHTQRTMRYFLKAQPLCEFFSINDIQLKILKAPCTNNRCYAGVFRQPPKIKGTERAYMADFDIDEEEWLRQIPEFQQGVDLEFKTDLEKYNKKYVRRMEVETEKRKNIKYQTVPEWMPQSQESKNDISAKDFLLPSSEFRQKLNARKEKGNDDMMSLHSIDVFNENDMKPIENLDLAAPRRRYDGIQLFEDVSSSDESDAADIQQDDLGKHSDIHVKQELGALQEDQKTINFVTSNLDYWILAGQINTLLEKQKGVLENKFPRSFFWLLETCAQIIGVEWSQLYEQLLAIEIMFGYGVEPLEKLQDCIYFKANNINKDINHLIVSFREIW